MRKRKRERIYKSVAFVLFAILLFFFVRDCYGADPIDKTTLAARLEYTTQHNFADAQVVHIANRALDRLGSVADIVSDSTMILTVDDDELYDLPAECIKVIAVCNWEGRCMDQIAHPGQAGKIPEGLSGQEDDYREWWVVMDKDTKWLGIRPIPDQDDDTILVIFQPRSWALVAADSADFEIPIREIYQSAFEAACYAIAFQDLQRLDKAAYYWELFTWTVNTTRQYLGVPPPDVYIGPRRIGQE